MHPLLPLHLRGDDRSRIGASKVRALEAAWLRRIGIPMLMLISTGRAWGQSPSDRETARLLMDRGDEQLEKGQLDEALNLYRGAHEIMRVPTTGIELARTLQRLGRWVEARDTALEVLRMPVARDESQPFKTAREAAEQMARELGDLIPLLTITIVPEEASRSAKLEIDGRPIPEALIGLPLPLDPMEHRIRLSAAGYRPLELPVALDRGERRNLSLSLQSLPRPIQQGNANGTAPVSPRSSRATLASTTLPPTQQSRKHDGALAWPFWLGVGVGGAGVVVGTVAGMLSLERTRDAKAHCVGNQCTPEAQGDLDAALSMANVSNVGFAIGALGASVGLVSWWFKSARGSGHDATRTLSVVGASGGGMLRLEGDL